MSHEHYDSPDQVPEEWPDAEERERRFWADIIDENSEFARLVRYYEWLQQQQEQQDNQEE